MFDPIFTPNVRDAHAKSLSIFTEIVATQFTPNEVTIYAYRIGRGCFHVLKLDNQLEITITDGQVDIPDKTHCLDYLRTGHIQIGAFDSMDVTYLINHLLNALKEKNEHLTYALTMPFFVSNDQIKKDFEFPVNQDYQAQNLNGHNWFSG